MTVIEWETHADVEMQTVPMCTLRCLCMEMAHSHSKIMNIMSNCCHNIVFVHAYLAMNGLYYSSIISQGGWESLTL